MNCHEAIDLMDPALEDHLSPDSRPGFDEHLAECSPCRTYLEQLRVTLMALERLPRPPVNSQHKSSLVSEFRRKQRERE